MSYSSRVYRQRNPKVQDEKKGTAFFPGKAGKGKGSDTFFQAKPEADSENKKPDMTRTTERQEDKPVQTKMADQEKEKQVNVPKQGDPLKEKETTIQKAGVEKEPEKDKKK